MNLPDMPHTVAAAFAQVPRSVRARLLDIRRLIFEFSERMGTVGPVTEALRWGEPAYLTQITKSGTTIRLGRSRSAPKDAAIFFNCQTSLVEEFRIQFADEFLFEKNRAVIIPHRRALPENAVKFCLCWALTYHLGECRKQRADS
ncbi:DUF1801 domain-containing protein [Roseicitreum antarcticum]|uniref:YdhG-like domain-containing protein n=1 Tax=Roseicitreum antarcticum TaxID=564137 RepID=A0A1H3B2U5_9RHOB|nr:DUF1801 domain-containing protein [Roseicitreum antarcticum]SDX36008.1 hypothetical protein SAMN04488238_107224 [Roseicitreum antarcticum]